jgi:hypothetical protein
MKYRNNIPVGRVTMLSRCPSCGKVVQNEPPADGTSIECPSLHFVSEEGGPVTAAKARLVVAFYFYHKRCGASWVIEGEFTCKWDADPPTFMIPASPELSAAVKELSAADKELSAADKDAYKKEQAKCPD